MYRNTVILLAISIILIFSLMAGPLRADTDKDHKTVVVSGAGLLMEPVTSYLNKFKEINSEYDSVIMGATTGKGFSSFIDYTSDVVMASRPMSEKEQNAAASVGIDPGKRFMGKVCLAIITSSPLTTFLISLERCVLASCILT